MALVLLVLALLLIPLPASANILFDWTGTCLTGCVGTATMHVETADAYVPGTTVQGRDLLLAGVYTDSNVTRDFLPGWLVNYIGFEFPVFGPEGAINMEDMGLVSHADGTWHFNCPVAAGGCPSGATGINGLWIEGAASGVPWPATAVLLLVALVPTARFSAAPRIATTRRSHRLTVER